MEATQSTGVGGRQGVSQPTPSDVPSISEVIPSEVIPKSEQGKAWNTGGITVRGSGIPCVRCVTCHRRAH